MVHFITAYIDNDIIINNLWENRCIFNKIRHIQAIENKLISLNTKPPTPDHIGDLYKSPIISEWYDSIFPNYEEMATSTTFSAPFLHSLLSLNTKILIPGISFRVKTTYIENQYDIYSRTCAYGSSMFEVF